MWEGSRVGGGTGPEKFFSSARSRNKSLALTTKRLERRDNSDALPHLERDQGQGLGRRGGERWGGAVKHINGGESFNPQPLGEGGQRRKRANEVIASLCWRGDAC